MKRQPEGGNLFWPEYATRIPQTYARVMKYIGDVQPLMARAVARKRTGLCVQAGAHLGLWPAELAKVFECVVCFEPDPALYLCAVENLKELNPAGNVIVHPFALVSHAGPIILQSSLKAGSWKVDPNGDVIVAGVSLNQVHTGQVLDALVLDIEGHEVPAMQGGRQRIVEDKPLVHLELLEENAFVTEAYIRGLGYRRVQRFRSDALFVPSGEV